MSIESDRHTAIARAALERVCSGVCVEEASQYYSPSFVDHVNGEELTGFAGIEKSVERYRRFVTGLRITVQEQLSEGDRVVCRFVVSGTVYGLCVSFDGITVSRIENGRIVEDWSVTGTLSLLRQLGVWRTAWIAIRYPG